MQLNSPRHYWGGGLITEPPSNEMRYLRTDLAVVMFRVERCTQSAHVARWPPCLLLCGLLHIDVRVNQFEVLKLKVNINTFLTKLT